MSEEDKKIFQRLIYYNDKEHLAKRIIELQHNIKDLWAQLQQKENIIKEVREYIADRVAPDVNDYNIEFRLKLNTTVDEFIRHLSEILDKENKIC